MSRREIVEDFDRLKDMLSRYGYAAVLQMLSTISREWANAWPDETKYYKRIQQRIDDAVSDLADDEQDLSYFMDSEDNRDEC